jgi:hypothetical protein
MKHSKEELLEYLKKKLDEYPDLPSRQFDKFEDRPCSESVYRHTFDTWERAKFLACQYKPPKKIAVKHKVKEIERFSPLETPHSDTRHERDRQIIAGLKLELKHFKKDRILTEDIRKYIFELVGTKPVYPRWLLKKRLGEGSVHGIPTLLVSDWHFGEIIKPNQVFGVNEFNSKVEDERVQILADNTIDICTTHLSSEYPGLVVLLNGDFVSGTIHDELIATSEKPIMPVVLKVYTSLKWFIDKLFMYFPKLVLFCCPGNHSRTVRKPVYKDKALITYDWLVYSLLEKHYEDNENIHFEITSGDDIQFKIYNHVYRMTHGAQFRGGQGFMGHIAPVTRGEIRKRSAAESYDRAYNTLVLGHFHSYGWFRRVIVNGSLVGYSEMSLGGNFPYERPQQALWITHPEHGITFRVPIFCSKKDVATKAPWVSWPRGGK